MARTLPSNLYSGDAVVLDTRQPMQYYMQRMAHQQAKSEALDNYYSNIHKSINPAGMRTQDLEGGFNQKVNSWREDYLKNKEAIKNPTLDNGAAYNRHRSGYQDLLADTEKSKDAAKKDIILAQHKLSGKWNATDGDLQTVHGIGSSIYSKDHYKADGVTPYDISDVSIAHPEFTTDRQGKFLKEAVGDLKPGYEEQDLSKAVIDKEHGKQSIPYSKKYTNEQLTQIGNRAGFGYDDDESAKRFFEGEMLNPSEHEQLNASFKRVYGRDISNPREAAQAFAIHNNLAAKEEGTKIQNWTDPNKAYKLKAIGLANSKNLIDYRKQAGLSAPGSDEEGIDPIEKMMRDQESDAVNGKKPGVYKTADGQETPTYDIKAPDALRKAMEVRVGAKVHQPDAVKIADNGDYLGVFYKKDADGVPIKGADGKFAVDPALPTNRVSRDNIKISLGKELLTKKANQQIMSQPKKTKATKSKDNPLGLDF